MRALLCQSLLALLLLLTRPSRANPTLLWGAVRPAPCDSECPQGACGFRDCAERAHCRGGGCMFVGCARPSCEGGGCKFVACADPECRGGACDFVETTTLLLDGFCSGGACTIEGFEARHIKADGSAVF